jgi:hypothetical protein
MVTRGMNVQVFPPGHPAAPPDGLVVEQRWDGTSDVPVETVKSLAEHAAGLAPDPAARLSDLNALRAKSGLPALAKLPRKERS